MHAAPAATAAADVEGEFAVDRPPGDFGLILRGGVRLLDVLTTAKWATLRKWRVVTLVDLLGWDRTPMSVATVPVTRLATGRLRLGIRAACLAERGRLALAVASRCV